MPKKLETVKLIASLEKAARKTKKGVWADLAERLAGASRSKVAVKLGKLNNIAKQSKGKILLVPGKILSTGELTEKTTIVSITVSEEAKKKILAKAEYITLKDFVAKAEKIDASKIIIVK